MTVGDLTVTQSVLVFLGIPALVVAFVLLATLAPGWTRAGRYRPGEPWNYEPILINGSVGTDVKQAITATPTGELAQDLALAVNKEGGASARW